MDRLNNPVFKLIKIMIINIINQSSSANKTQNISYYHPKSSPYNKKESNDQESHSNINNEEEKLIFYNNLEKNSPKVDIKDNYKEEEREISGNNCATKNTTNAITSNIIEKNLIVKKIISTVKLNCTLNLEEIASKVNNAKYGQNQLIMKIKDPKAKAIILSDGTMFCHCPKNEEQSKKSCRKFAKIIKNLGYNVTLTNFKIQNMKGSFKLKYKLSLNSLSLHLMKNVKSKIFYEPELSHVLIYHYDRNPNIVYIIFESGRIVIIGAKSRNQIYEALLQVYPLLNKYKKPN